MIYLVYISLLFAYSLVLASTVLVIWSLRNGGAGVNLGKSIGALVFILSLITMLCTGYYSVRYWSEGAFEAPIKLSQEMHQDSMEMRHDMMNKMMPLIMDKMAEHMKTHTPEDSHH